ncbi:MAG: hypothetical protein ACOYEV_05635 [Candidatus Nanopelagicales bacterium]
MASISNVGRGFRFGGGRAAVVLAAAVFSAALSTPGAAAQLTPPAVAPAATCSYLVKDVVKMAGGLYLGEFIVLRQVERKLTGYSGAFYSEWGNLRGVIRGKTVKLRFQDPYDNGWTTVTRKWVPREHRLAGWKSVSKAKIKKYSGGGVPLSGKVCA